MEDNFLNSNFKNIDFIGDIHGHSAYLKTLLNQLGYIKLNSIYQHPEGRKVIFLGDLIDRGPNILEVLEIVKSMVDSGNAISIIGNHEYNFICFFTSINGKYLRSHSQKNKIAIRDTLTALNNDIELINYYLNWFKTLPIYFEHYNFRVVHAQWKSKYISILKERGIVNFANEEFLINSVIQNSEEYKLVNCLLKGEDIKIPGVKFSDKDGNKREAYRIKWWMVGKDLLASEYLFDFTEHNNKPYLTFSSIGYPENDVPVFFGHYCLKINEPILFQNNCCCLDMCISKAGKLVAYRFDGEQKLDIKKFFSASTI